MDALSIPKTSVELQWKILIIDDDEDDYLIVKDMLQKARGRKFEIDWAPTYQAGMAKLWSHPYHAVLVDYDLGQHTGIDLIRAANERGYSAPLILFTGRGTYETDVEAMQAGATMYLSKGEVNPLLLERAIRYAIERKGVEGELRHSEEKFATAFENNPAAMTITRSIDGLYTEVNRSFCQMTGYRREEIIGHSSVELGFFSQEMRDTVLRLFQRDGSVHDQEFPVIDRSGAVRYVLFSLDPIVVNGEASIIATMIEITERKRAEENLRLYSAALQKSEEKFAKSFRASPLAMAVSTAAEGRFIEVNERFTELLGFNREELIGHTSTEIRLWASEDRDKVVRRFLREGVLRNHQIRLYTKSREPKNLLFSAERIEIEGQDCILALAIDMTG